MLGENRSKAAFRAASEESVQKELTSSKEPPAATEEPEAPGVRLAAPEKARTLRTHDLFFGAEDKNQDFTSVQIGRASCRERVCQYV